MITGVHLLAHSLSLALCNITAIVPDVVAFGVEDRGLQQHNTLCLQVNKKFCELKGGNIGIVEKAQETRFGMSRKYSRYIGIAS